MMRKISPAFLAACLVFLLILYFVGMSPMMADNFVFSRAIEPGFAAFYSGESVEASPLTIANAIAQAREMYSTWCGRFLGNLAVYCLFMLPRPLYCLLAALTFVFYVLLLQMCVFGRQWRQHLTPAWILGLAAMLWAGMPSFGEAFLWLGVGGQTALLGQALILLPFRFALDGKGGSGRLRLFLAPILLAGGIAAASLDYATSAALPVTGAACLCWLYFRHKKPLRKVPALPLCATIGLFIGAALTLGAPGNAQRLLLTRDPEVHAYLAASWGERLADWLLHLPGALLMQFVPLLLLLWGCLALWQRHGRQWPAHVPPAALLFLLPALLTLGAYLFTSWPPARAFATVNAQLLICAAIVFTAAELTASSLMWRQFRILSLLLCLYCLVSIPVEAVKFYQLRQIVAQREDILKSGAATAVLPALPPGSADGYWVLGGNLPDVSGDSDFWVNRAMAAHYGLASVILRKKPASYETPPGLARIGLQKDRIDILARDGIAGGEGRLYFYYYGKPALLNQLPRFLGHSIFNWLARGKAGDLRLKLAPILLARADLPLRPHSAGMARGSSDILKIMDDSRLWLVRPGQSKLSFDLLPLAKNPDSGM